MSSPDSFSRSKSMSGCIKIKAHLFLFVGILYYLQIMKKSILNS